MADIKAELSSKNDYWIPKHRYYELKHFCLQYRDWRQSYGSVNCVSSPALVARSGAISDPVEHAAKLRLFFKDRMDMVEQAAHEADPTIWNRIFKAVTEGLSYDVLNAREPMPCSREYYYAVYRRFFWILSRMRN